MKSVLICFVFLITIAISSLALALPIEPETKTVVTFIFVTDGKGKRIANGTGFFVGVKNKEKPDIYAVYLVTAKHVFLKDEKDEKSFFPFVFVRINKQSGGAETLRLDLITEGTRKNVFTHDDPSVDIAVVPALPDQGRYDFKFLPDDFLTTKDEFKKLNIREGSDVFFTGLFTPQFEQDVGDQRNYPIVRFGKVALVSEEKINWGKLNAELYLIEGSSYGGNSGSPVYFHLGAEREPSKLIVGNPVLKLAGVMQGTFTKSKQLTVIETSAIPAYSSTMGIAFVVPAYKLHEILFSDELKKSRGF